MTRVSRLLLAAAIIPLGAAKPPPTTGAANPEIAYVDSKPRYPEIKLANEDLTGSATVYRSKVQYRMPRFDLSPRGQRQIAVASQDALELVTFAPTSTGIQVVETRTLYSGPGQVLEVSFSADGAKIAFHNFLSATESRIKVYDLATSAVTDLGLVNYPKDLEWYSDGSAIVYVDDGSVDVVTEKRMDGSDHPLFSEPNIESIDVSRSPGNRTIVIGYSRPDGQTFHLGLWNNGGYVAEHLAAGINGHYKCDDSRIVFRGDQRTNQSSYFYNVGTNSTSLLTRNSDVQRVDYMPTC